MSFRIRLAEQGDAPGAVRVVRAVYEEHGFTWDSKEYHADLYDLQSHYVDPGNPFWVAEDTSGRILGTAALELYETLSGVSGELIEHQGRMRIGGTDCSMERLYVDPEARRMGLGRALACQVVSHARSLGRRNMELWSDKRFDKAHSLYISMGARIVGERICHDPDQSPEWGLLLPIVER